MTKRNWSGNSLWRNIFLDIEDGFKGMRYKVSNDYDSICDAINETYIHKLVGTTLIIKNIGTLKIVSFDFDSKYGQLIIKSDLASTAGR